MSRERQGEKNRRWSWESRAWAGEKTEQHLLSGEVWGIDDLMVDAVERSLICCYAFLMVSVLNESSLSPWT